MMASRLQTSAWWGRRAEDPFRGLRAGPVRSSPHFFAWYFLPEKYFHPFEKPQILLPIRFPSSLGDSTAQMDGSDKGAACSRSAQERG
jgi:hypothetical protein